MLKGDRLPRSYIFDESIDRWKLAVADSLDPKAAGKRMAYYGLRRGRSILCDDDVFAGTFLSVYVYREIFIFSYHAMDRIWIC